MKTQILFSFILIAILTSCVPQKKNTFYWGEYSSTLYALKKNPDEKTLAAHKEQIIEIFNESDKNNRKVPPGVFAEYGYILIKEGKEKEGLEFLDKEMLLYPESAVFIQKIKKEFTGREK